MNKTISRNKGLLQALVACAMLLPLASCKKDAYSSFNPNIPVAVDLGLSVKWASCNVGATSPEEFGDYFAWGETEPKQYYYEDNYKFGPPYRYTKYVTDSRYGTVDNKTVLETCDDAAAVNWGGKWRMPTAAECEELCNAANCSWSRTRFKGVDGWMVQSRKVGYEEKWIFLPCAGWSINGDTYLYYYSSSVYSNSFYATGIDSWDAPGGIGILYRYYGYPVRPVSD